MRTEEELGGGVVIGHSLHQDPMRSCQRTGLRRVKAGFFAPFRQMVHYGLVCDGRSALCGAEFIGVGASEGAERCAVWGS